MSGVRLLAFVAGLAILIGTASSVFTTLVVPRQHYSRTLRVVARPMVKVALWIAAPLKTYDAKDRLMGLVGPLAIVTLFLVWFLLFVIGFGLMTWWVSGVTFAHALAIAGSSVFTLGVATGPHPGSTVLEVLAAASGFFVIAMEIAYLPALYSAFAAREEDVTLLAPRAGSPAWGPEILARHYWFRTTAELPELYASWEAWAANVAESHSNYPPLMWFRSPVAYRSWLASMAAMLDAAALHDSLNPGSSPRQARIFLMMGIDCLRALARALRIPYDPDPLPSAPLRLTRQDFDEGLGRLDEVGYEAERTPDEAWPHFSGWRVGYEPIIDELTRRIMAPPAPWLLDRPEVGPITFPLVLNRSPDDPEGRPSSAKRGRSLPGHRIVTDAEAELGTAE